MATKSRGVLEFALDVVVEPDGDAFHAYCPALKGLHVDGRTQEEALNNAADAAIAYIESLIDHGEPIPVGVISESGANSRDAQTKRLSISLA